MDEELLPEEKNIPKKKKKKKKKEQLLTISDRCKNCDKQLKLDEAYCSSCGAKRMYNRLNWRNLTEDFVDRFLNIENNFLRTFIDLFTKPEDVIGGYIDGMRKRYLSAFSYFAISLTITGLYFFVFRKLFLTEAVVLESFQSQNTSAPGSEGIAQEATKMMNWVFEYQAVIAFINIPFYALVSKLVFWNYKKYNFIEHVVIYLYIYSHTQIIGSVLGALFIWSVSAQMIISPMLILLYIGYAVYVLIRLFDLTVKQILLKTLLFFVIFGVLSFVLTIVGGWLMYEFGFFDSFIEKIKVIEKEQKAIKEAVRDSIRMDSIKQLTKRVKDTILLFGT